MWTSIATAGNKIKCCSSLNQHRFAKEKSVCSKPVNSNTASLASWPSFGHCRTFRWTWRFNFLLRPTWRAGLNVYVDLFPCYKCGIIRQHFLYSCCAHPLHCVISCRPITCFLKFANQFRVLRLMSNAVRRNTKSIWCVKVTNGVFIKFYTWIEDYVNRKEILFEIISLLNIIM